MDCLKVSKEIKTKIIEADKAVTKATKTLLLEDFPQEKNLPNEIKRRIEEDQTDYLKTNLSNHNRDFRTFNKELGEENKTPTRILHEGEEIFSQKKLA